MTSHIQSAEWRKKISQSKMGVKNPAFVHGMANTKTYYVWHGIMCRCRCKTNSQWKYYGGRGITVCDRWLTFSNFFADMGEKPKGCSIERIDNDKGYNPSNCKWATPKEQASNRRNTRLIEFNGTKKTISEWGRTMHLSRATLTKRLSAGWPVQVALMLPPLSRQLTRASWKGSPK